MGAISVSSHCYRRSTKLRKSEKTRTSWVNHGVFGFARAVNACNWVICDATEALMNVTVSSVTRRRPAYLSDG